MPDLRYGTLDPRRGDLPLQGAVGSAAGAAPLAVLARPRGKAPRAQSEEPEVPRPDLGLEEAPPADRGRPGPPHRPFAPLTPLPLPPSDFRPSLSKSTCPKPTGSTRLR